MKVFVHRWSALGRVGVTARRLGLVLIPILLAAGMLIVADAGFARDPHALHAAASGGDPEKFDEFVARLADVNERDDLGFTPLALAAWYGRHDGVRMLLARGAAVDAGHPMLGTPLMLALSNGHVEIARDLLKGGADVQVQCESGDPLTSAVRSNKLECLSLVIAAGADLNAVGRRYNLLTGAVQDSDVEVMRYLLDAGVDPNLPDADGTTPLHNAVECDAPGAVRALLLAGADPDCADPRGLTPLAIARSRDCHEVLELLDDQEGPRRGRAPAAMPIAGAGSLDTRSIDGTKLGPRAR